jgi:hypothetical protein
MSSSRETHVLTDDLDYWVVDLKAGGRITVRAHAVGEEGGYYVFVALMEGDPPYEYQLVRIPTEVVADFSGGGSLTPPNDLT